MVHLLQHFQLKFRFSFCFQQPEVAMQRQTVSKQHAAGPSAADNDMLEALMQFDSKSSTSAGGTSGPSAFPGDGSAQTTSGSSWSASVSSQGAIVVEDFSGNDANRRHQLNNADRSSASAGSSGGQRLAAGRQWSSGSGGGGGGGGLLTVTSRTRSPVPTSPVDRLVVLLLNSLFSSQL